MNHIREKELEMKTFSGAEFAKLVSERRLPTTVELTGFINEEDSTPQELAFCPSSTCGQWLKIPVSLIETVEHYGNRACLPHGHPSIVLHLKHPSQENLEAATLAQLLSARSMGARHGALFELAAPKCWRVLVYYQGQWQLNDYYSSEATADYYADQFRRAGYPVRVDALNGPCPH